MRQIMLTISAAAILAMLAGPAAARQDGDEKPDKTIAPAKPQARETGKTTKDTEARTERTAPPAKEAPAGRDASAGRSESDAKGGPAGKGAPEGMGDGKAGRKQIMLEEAKYRKRMAKIRRLRELAQKQGNNERLKALDGLEAKLNASHERKLAMWKARLGDEQFGRVEKRLKQGRGGKGKAGGRGRESGRPTARDRAGGGGARDISGGGGKPAGKGTGKPTGKITGKITGKPAGKTTGKPAGKTSPAATDEDAAAQKRKQMEAERRKRSREMEKAKSKEDAPPKSKGGPR